MNALIIGKNNPLERVLADDLGHHNFEVTLSSDRTRLPLENYDICVDTAAQGIRDVKLVIGSLNYKISHYIFLSSCCVYPPVARLSLWDPNSIDLCDETGFDTVELSIRRYRAAERELKHIGSKKIPWTILRPSIVEMKQTPNENYMWWFVSRIIDGGPIVLPDDDDPLFRHVADKDLAKAVRILATKKESFFKTIHVTSHTLLSYESYARLIMRCINKKVPLVRISGARWKAAGLTLPMGENAWSSFINNSEVLERLGWEETDECQWVQEYARNLVKHPLRPSGRREIEIALTSASENISSFPMSDTVNETWCLLGEPGKSYSAHIGHTSKENALSFPLLRPLQIAMGIAEQRFLIDHRTDTTPRIMVHNALLELIEPAQSELNPGSIFLPVAQRPCGEDGCPHCSDYGSGIAGIDDDGFGVGYVSVPKLHLVPIPSNLSRIALLADPLACLLSVLPSLIQENEGQVWIFGQLVDTMLGILLVKDTDRPFTLINRSKLIKKYPFELELRSLTLQHAAKKARDNIKERPSIIINLSGSNDGENLLAHSLQEGGFLVTPFVKTQMHRRRVDVNLPVIAPGKLWIEKALHKLSYWSEIYPLDSLLKSIPLEQFYDLFIPGQFCQNYVDITRVAK